MFIRKKQREKNPLCCFFLCFVIAVLINVFYMDTSLCIPSCFLKQKTTPSYSRPPSWAGSHPGERWTSSHCPGEGFGAVSAAASALGSPAGRWFTSMKGECCFRKKPASHSVLDLLFPGWDGAPGLPWCSQDSSGLLSHRRVLGAAPSLGGASPPTITTSLDLLTSSPASPA